MFRVGQAVGALFTVFRPAATGAHEIRALVPADERDSQNPRFRIRNTTEKFERVVPESELGLCRCSKPLSG